jgi:hypothetical protein
VSRNAWAEAIEQTQVAIRESPDYCFVCGELVPDEAPEALIQAFLDAGHRDRLAVVCGRRACRLALQDGTNGTWQRFFDALTHWPDTAIYPHGPHWVIRRPHQLTFRTAPRRTTVSTAASPDDPDDRASLPAPPARPAPARPLTDVQPRPVRHPRPNRPRR